MDDDERQQWQDSTAVGQLRNIRTPHTHDVLSGRGHFVNYHIGNENFRALVNGHKKAYVACSKSEKSNFSKTIYDEICSRDPPGRFLERDSATKLWNDIGVKKALEKTRQALREGAPELLKALNYKTSNGAMLSVASSTIREEEGLAGGGGVVAGVGNRAEVGPFAATATSSRANEHLLPTLAAYPHEIVARVSTSSSHSVLSGREQEGRDHPSPVDSSSSSILSIIANGRSRGKDTDRLLLELHRLRSLADAEVDHRGGGSDYRGGGGGIDRHNEWMREDAMRLIDDVAAPRPTLSSSVAALRPASALENDVLDSNLRLKHLKLLRNLQDQLSNVQDATGNGNPLSLKTMVTLWFLDSERRDAREFCRAHFSENLTPLLQAWKIENPFVLQLREQNDVPMVKQIAMALIENTFGRNTNIASCAGGRGGESGDHRPQQLLLQMALAVAAANHSSPSQRASSVGPSNPLYSCLLEKMNQSSSGRQQQQQQQQQIPPSLSMLTLALPHLLKSGYSSVAPSMSLQPPEMLSSRRQQQRPPSPLSLQGPYLPRGHAYTYLRDQAKIHGASQMVATSFAESTGKISPPERVRSSLLTRDVRRGGSEHHDASGGSKCLHTRKRCRVSENDNGSNRQRSEPATGKQSAPPSNLRVGEIDAISSLMGMTANDASAYSKEQAVATKGFH